MDKARRALKAATHGDFATLVAKGVARARRRPRVLYKHPMPGGDSARRINRLLAGMPDARAYLEIGLATGTTLESVEAPLRWGVDPRPQFDVRRLPPGVHVHVGTSDEFFEQLPFQETQFDLVFLDGLHTFRQTYRDLINSFRLFPKAIILMDDVVPVDEASAIPDYDAAIKAHRRLGLSRSPHIWQGDVFRVLLTLRSYHPELKYCTIEGPHNPQALIWNSQDSTRVEGKGDSELRSIEAIKYGNVFDQGIPEYFLPTTEDAALESALRPCLPENERRP